MWLCLCREPCIKQLKETPIKLEIKSEIFSDKDFWIYDKNLYLYLPKKSLKKIGDFDKQNDGVIVLVFQTRRKTLFSTHFGHAMGLNKNQSLEKNKAKWQHRPLIYKMTVVMTKWCLHTIMALWVVVSAEKIHGWLWINYFLESSKVEKEVESTSLFKLGSFSSILTSTICLPLLPSKYIYSITCLMISIDMIKNQHTEYRKFLFYLTLSFQKQVKFVRFLLIEPRFIYV